VPAKGTMREGGSPNQQTEGCNKRRRRRLRDRGRPLGNTKTNQTRGVPRRNKKQQRQAKAWLEGEGGWGSGQHENQPNMGGATVQQEAAAPEGRSNKRGREAGAPVNST
jgi:hypothetical protein